MKQLAVKAPAPEYQLRVGGEYLVLGITFLIPTAPHGGGVRYEILNDYEKVRSIPACLFELIDGRPSIHWLGRQDPDGSFLLWPEAFYEDYFHDDLSEGQAQALGTLTSVVKMLRQEHVCPDH